MNKLCLAETGLTIPLISASFSQSSSQWVTTFSFNISGDYTGDLVGEKLVYTLGNQAFNLLIDDESSAKTTKGKNRTVTGRALTTLLEPPNSERIALQTWRNVMFSAIAAELCTAAGLSFDLPCPDFKITRYSATKRSPIDVLKDIANDVKIQLQTSLDGLTLIACKKYQFSPKNLPLANAKVINRLFSEPKQLENVENFDAIKVHIDVGSDSATVEQKKIEDAIRVRVFLPNWSATPPTLDNCGGTVQIEYRGIKTVNRWQDEISIDNGRGKITAGAVYQSHHYYGEDLGLIAIDSDGTVNTSVADCGLVKIGYSLPCHEFLLRSDCCDKIRIKVLEPDNQGMATQEVRIRSGNRYAEPLAVKYTKDRHALIMAGTQALIDLQDFETYTLPADHWDDLPLPNDIIEFGDGLRGYCDGFSVEVGSSAIKSTITVKVPVEAD